MKRTQKQLWYIGRLVRLICDVTTRGKRTFGEGRVFRVFSVWRGKLSLGPPAIGVLFGENASEIERLPFAHAELLPGFETGKADTCRPTERGFCRVCGCVDSAGCPPDERAKSCWWSEGSNQTLCSRCVPALIVAGKRSRVPPAPYLMRTLDWTIMRTNTWLTEHPEPVKRDDAPPRRAGAATRGGGLWVWDRAGGGTG